MEDVGPINISIPFPSHISPDLDRARPRHLKWITDFDLLADQSTQAAYEASDFPLFVARVYPWAQGADLDLLTNYLGWSWVFDDSFDQPHVRKSSTEEIAATLDDYRDVMYGRPARSVDISVISSFRQLWGQLKACTSETWLQRHCAHWEHMLQGYQREADNNYNGITPDLENYLRLRHGTAGVDTCTDFVEAIGRFELPLDVHAEPTFLKLRRCMTEVVALTNDVFSARKEWKQGNNSNIILVIAGQENCSWKDASEVAHKIIAENVESFQSSEMDFYSSVCYNTLSLSDQANTRFFIQGLKDWMRGNLDFHISSHRYR